MNWPIAVGTILLVVLIALILRVFRLVDERSDTLLRRQDEMYDKFNDRLDRWVQHDRR